MLTTALAMGLALLVGGAIVKVLWEVLKLVFKGIGTLVILPFLLIGGLIALPFIIIGKSIGLLFDLLPLLLGGGLLYLLYGLVTEKDRRW